MKEETNDRNDSESVVHGIRTDVYPHKVYVAEDSVRPRWRVQFLLRNRRDREVEFGECRILYRTGASGPWQQAQAVKLSSTNRPEAAGPDIAVGPARVAAGGGTGLDLRDCVSGGTPSAIRVEVDVHADGSAEATTVSRVVPLIPQRTRYIAFPLEGEWVAGNARADLHGLGFAFAFDFITEADWKIHLTRKGEDLRPGQFDSFDRPLYSPVHGRVVACESAMPDLSCAIGAATYSRGSPEGLPKMAVFGNWILIETDDADYVLLVHLKQGSALVQPGARVTVGQLIGQIGNSGNTSGAHLHIEILDGIPEFEKRLTGGFEQSGLPFGFRDVDVRGSAGCRSGDLVPGKGETVVARASSLKP